MVKEWFLVDNAYYLLASRILGVHPHPFARHIDFPGRYTRT